MFVYVGVAVTIVYFFLIRPSPNLENGPANAFTYKSKHSTICESAAYFTWKMPSFATSWLFGKTEAELRGGGGRCGGGEDPSPPTAPPLPQPPPLSPCCTGMAWERIPHPTARRHPATKYNTNSIKCSLRCDLPQWMINCSSFSHCRISEIAIIGRIVICKICIGPHLPNLVQEGQLPVHAFVRKFLLK